jgi:anti-sigma regulatory factor (Ser/Thr protein kinase)
VAAARLFVEDAVRSWGVEPPEALPLLTSEVVTNAVVHTDATWVEVRAVRTGNRARVEVADQDPTVPSVQPSDPASPGGFGMWLVDRLARAWGVTEIEDDGKFVWFELPVSMP